MSDTLIMIEFCNQCGNYQKFSRLKHDSQAAWECKKCGNKQIKFRQYISCFGVGH